MAEGHIGEPKGLVRISAPKAFSRHVLQPVLASPSYLSKHAPILKPEDLMTHSCLSIGERARDSRWHFVRGKDEVDVPVVGRYTVNHSEMRLAAVEAGLGLGCVPDFVANDALVSGKVVRLLREWSFNTNYQGTAYLLFVASRYTTPKARVLIDYLVASLSSANSAAIQLPP